MPRWLPVFLNNLVRKLIMKKIVLSLAAIGFSVAAASSAFANAGKFYTSTVWVQNNSRIDVIAEALDKNCEVIVAKKVCAHECTKLVIKCTKSFKFAACPADGLVPIDSVAGFPTNPTCEGNPGTRFCSVDSPTSVKITTDKYGNLNLDCFKKRDIIDRQ